MKSKKSFKKSDAADSPHFIPLNIVDKGVFPESSITVTRRFSPPSPRAPKNKPVVANKIRMKVATLSHILIPGVVGAVTEFKALRTLTRSATLRPSVANVRIAATIEIQDDMATHVSRPFRMNKEDKNKNKIITVPTGSNASPWVMTVWGKAIMRVSLLSISVPV